MLEHDIIKIWTWYEDTFSYDRDVNMRLKRYEVIWRERKIALHHVFEGSVWNLTKCRRVGLITHMCGCRNVCLATCILCALRACVRALAQVWSQCFLRYAYWLATSCCENTLTHATAGKSQGLFFVYFLYCSLHTKHAKPESTNVPLTHQPPLHLLQ